MVQSQNIIRRLRSFKERHRRNKRALWRNLR